MKTNRFNFSQYILVTILFVLDISALFTSLEVAMFLRHNYFTEYLPLFDLQNIGRYYWVIIIVLLMLILEKIYFVRHDFWGDFKRIVNALFFSFLAVFTTITLTKMSDEYSRVFIIIFFLTATVLMPIFKRVFKKIIFKYDFFKLKVKIVAKGSQEEILRKEMSGNWYFGFSNSVKSYDLVIIDSKSFEATKLETIIKEYASTTKDIYVIPYMDHLDFSHATIMDYSNIRLSAIHLENRLLNYKNVFIKYIFEKTATFIIFPFALLIHIFIALAIKMDSKGTVIFKQKRLGKDAKPFSCYKYRTMYEEGQDILNEHLQEHPDEVQYYKKYHKYQYDPRITKVGSFLRKTSLDEFPQFYNIIQGKMNLIGPRPYMLEEKSQIGKLHEDIILKVKPGITGLWQVNGRNNLSFTKRVELDNWYIQNWSLWGDFVILIKTVKVVLFKVGAR